MKNIFAFASIALLTTFGAYAGNGMNGGVDLNELSRYVYPNVTAAKPKAMTFSADGLSYYTLTDNGHKIEKTSLGNDGKSETLFDVTRTRELTLPSIDGYIVSPDESKILVSTDTESVYRRSKKATYYVYDMHSRILTPLAENISGQQEPLFSPDSRMVAFAAGNNIYVRKLDYNTLVQVTTDGETNKIINGTADWTYEEEFATTASMAWAPDNNLLCYVRYDESEVPMYNMPVYYNYCSPDPNVALYPGTYSYKYPVAGKPNSVVSVHAYDIETRKIKEVELPDKNIEYIPRIAYAGTTDQPRLMVVALNRNQNRMELYSANPRSGVVKSLVVEESDTWITPCTYEAIHFGPNSFVINSARNGYNNLYEYTYAGALKRTLTNAQYDVTAYYGSDAKGNHYYQAATPTPMDRTVMRIDAKNITTVISKPTGTSSATFTPTLGHYIMQYSDTKTPPVYTLHNAADKAIKVLEDNERLASRVQSQLLDKQFFTINSDGNALNAYMIRPPHFDASHRYPVIMYQYSGPDSQEVLNKWAMDWQYYYARQGYIIVCVDGRGTGGRGRNFAGCVYKNLGHYESIDQINAARYMASQPYVDSERIGIFGWSYGGYEALMASSQTDSPYAATVAVAPVTDWRFYDTVYAERYMLTPQQNEDGYTQSAPLMAVTRINNPLLIMYGTADDNVHPDNTLQYVSALHRAGKMCDMMVFPGMNHSINYCNARTMVYGKMLDYFNQHLKNK